MAQLPAAGTGSDDDTLDHPASAIAPENGSRTSVPSPTALPDFTPPLGAAAAQGSPWELAAPVLGGVVAPPTDGGGTGDGGSVYDAISVPSSGGLHLGGDPSEPPRGDIGTAASDVTSQRSGVGGSAGGNFPVAASGSASATVADLGSGDGPSPNDAPSEIDGTDVNGQRSWAEIYDTMSGALKETDQHFYDFSRSSTQIDKYDPAGSEIRADLYDPQSSAAIGQYVYGSSGHVDEVIDLLHSHDWISQSDGSYRDQTSGASSRYQPTLG